MSGIASVILGLLYLPSISGWSMPIIELGPELEGGQRIAAIWGLYALYGGVGIVFGSFLFNLSQSITYRRMILTAALVSAFLLAAAQTPPLFWRFLMSTVAFSWSNALGFTLHLILFVVSLWGAIVTIRAMEQTKKP